MADQLRRAEHARKAYFARLALKSDATRVPCIPLLSVSHRKRHLVEVLNMPLDKTCGLFSATVGDSIKEGAMLIIESIYHGAVRHLIERVNHLVP